jgi:cell division protein FtsZ
MSEGGAALMAVGRGSGEARAAMAAQEAISSRLLDVTIDGARGILFNITGGDDLSLFEVNEAAEIIRETAHPEANIIFGAVIDEALADEVRITVVATGFDNSTPQPQQKEQRVAVAPAPPRQAERSPEATEKPRTASRRTSAPRSQVEMQIPELVGSDELDIPPFLRRR